MFKFFWHLILTEHKKRNFLINYSNELENTVITNIMHTCADIIYKPNGFKVTGKHIFQTGKLLTYLKKGWSFHMEQ